ncbi:Putative ATP-dependent RNA helicase DEAD-box, Helicase superfamily 1/2, ATP-binding protein [Septoria linicola]|uniref:RNA helicase n=1 Tax=Septoria linicola TaxID=215465 RepID=A0A9Q9AWN9_9PEZI|nr:Putative ATP-dependent RNA helicase DEAD-box, Helicase superfamily 1/2, ATP-binding protein [Septoria linicola]
MVREVSPALSENEFDISQSLFGGDPDLLSDNSDTEQLPTSTRADSPRSRRPPAIEDASDSDDAFIAATQTNANRKNDSKTAKKAGAFQGMGLNTHLLKAITRKGFSVPTPIQRKTIPLILDGQDVVGMARTGSGKTAAFVIPMIEKLKVHSAKFGARAMILSPSRELALQTLRVVKEMGKGTDLRTVLIVGGDSIEDNFGTMAANPDIIIATPGRFEHVKVEMGLDLSSVKYMVFDEADRLFEMGFAAQLTEIMHSLPATRQTLLFSATLPKSLVEFARAGLQDPKLVRLDAESKIAPGLQSTFFTVKRAEKEGALLHILQDVIKMPTGAGDREKLAKEARKGDKKRKRGADGPAAYEATSPHSTVIFTATKHHVEYLANFLKAWGYATSYVYGSLDQTARKMQVQDFRSGVTNILVVTDVAARGLDVPLLANVINYDFPSQPKIFVHRVGRTARAGKEGWSYSLISQPDMPYLLDLQLFLSRKLIMGRSAKEPGMFQNAIVVGNLRRDALERYTEEAAKVIDEDIDLQSMRDVAAKGEKQYMRTRNSASAESVKRTKQIAQSEDSSATNMLFEADESADVEQQRLNMLARVSNFRPVETVFEVGKRGDAKDAAAEVMKKRRANIEAQKQKKAMQTQQDNSEDEVTVSRAVVDDDSDEDELVLTQPNGADMDLASDSELEFTFTAPSDPATSKRQAKKDKKAASAQDDEFFMSYTPSTINMVEDKGYGVHSGGTNASTHFLDQARNATMDLNGDEDSSMKLATKAGAGLRWDKKSKKYVQRANDEDGSKGAKMIRGESGQKIAASFKSGRFDRWRKDNRVERLPRVGEMEKANAHHAYQQSQNGGGGSGPGGNGGGQGRRFQHKQERAPKEADKYRDDYHVRKKRVAEAKEKRVGRFAEGKGKNELRGVDDVRKLRKLAERRKEKNARPSKKRR